MATVRVKDVIQRVRLVLNDPTKTGWSDEELLTWYNAAIVAIITMRPDALTKAAKFLCDRKTRQTLPTEAIRLVRVDRNSNGAAIRQIDRAKLDEQIPFWHDTRDIVDNVEFYVFDIREPKVFYVYPAPLSGHAIDIVYSYSPTPVTLAQLHLDSTVIAIDDSFQDAIHDYMIFRAFTKDSDFADAGNKSTLHFQSFSSFLQGKNESDTGIKPNAKPV